MSISLQVMEPLPGELVQLIFMQIARDCVSFFVVTAPRVCRQWRRILHEEWRLFEHLYLALGPPRTLLPMLFL